MARYQLKGTFVDQSGNAVADGTASITLTATGDAAKAYDAKSGGSTVSSVSSSDNGYFEAFIDEADYNSSELFSLTLSRSGFQSQQIDNIMVIPEVTLNGTQTLSNKTIEDTLVCSSDLTVAGDFTITGKFTASSDLDVTGNLVVDGNITSSGSFTVENLVTCSSGLTPDHIYGTIGSSSGTFSQPILTSPFISDFTNATQDHLSSSGGGTLSGFAIQTVIATNSSDLTGTNNLPTDDTIPQVGEMNAFADTNVSITPTDASNTLLITATASISSTGPTPQNSIAVFRDAETEPIAIIGHTMSAADFRTSLSLQYPISASSTTSQTFKLYFASSAGDSTINGDKGSRDYGGKSFATLSVTEIQS